jgi:hypothetical protein
MRKAGIWQKQGFLGGRERAKALCEGLAEARIQKKHGFLGFSAFFYFTSPCFVPYDRIDKRRDRTFPHRFVFFEPSGSRRANGQFSSESK